MLPVGCAYVVNETWLRRLNIVSLRRCEGLLKEYKHPSYYKRLELKHKWIDIGGVGLVVLLIQNYSSTRLPSFKPDPGFDPIFGLRGVKYHIAHSVPPSVSGVTSITALR